MDILPHQKLVKYCVGNVICYIYRGTFHKKRVTHQTIRDNKLNTYMQIDRNAFAMAYRHHLKQQFMLPKPLTVTVHYDSFDRPYTGIVLKALILGNACSAESNVKLQLNNSRVNVAHLNFN